ncbi:GNAT family N-acetyltransferase, partial [Rhizobiaceae sp. 2RAB30]
IIVDRPGSMIHVVDLAIVPSLRNRGIGTTILQDILHEAARSGVPTQLYVSSENDPSLRLYQRLGFIPLVSDPSYILLEWRSETATELLR